MLHTMLKERKRGSRQLLESNVRANKKRIKISMKANGNNNHLYLWSEEGQFRIQSNGSKTINVVIEDSNDLLGVTSRFFNIIQENWMISLACIVLILLTICLLCHAIHYYCFRMRKLLTKDGKVKKMTVKILPSSTLLGKDRSDEL